MFSCKQQENGPCAAFLLTGRIYLNSESFKIISGAQYCAIVALHSFFSELATIRYACIEKIHVDCSTAEILSGFPHTE